MVAVGTRMPAWVADGWAEYARRFPHPWQLELKAVPVAGKMPPERACELENRRLVQAIPDGLIRVALDPAGKPWSTEQLAGRLERWRDDGHGVAFLVGGAEGLNRASLDACASRWSLGALTLPHMLVRIILAEQLYRGWSILNNHPYHRA